MLFEMKAEKKDKNFPRFPLFDADAAGIQFMLIYHFENWY